MNTISKSLIVLITILASSQALSAQRSNQNYNYREFGLFAGVGLALSATKDCSWCDSEGVNIQLGYDASNQFGVELVYGQTSTDSDTINVDFDFAYAGVNIGDNFNTQWFKLYGKLGAIRILEDGDYAENSPVVGLGFTVSPMGGQKRFQLKFDIITSVNQNSEVTMVSAAMVYKF